MIRAADVMFESEGVHLCGHRGNSIQGTENSKSALRNARSRGATLCEIDIRLTADEEFVVYHDPVLDTTSTGAGPIRSLPLADLRALRHKPRETGAYKSSDLHSDELISLEETLSFAHDLQLGLIIEVKDRLSDPAHIKKLVEIINSSQLYERSLLSSFDHVFLKELKEMHPEVSTFGIFHTRHVNPIRLAKEADLDVYSVDYPRFHEGDAKVLSEAGVNVATFFPRPIFVQEHWDTHLEGLVETAKSARNGNIKILGVDDVKWGESYMKKHEITKTNFASTDVMA